MRTPRVKAGPPRSIFFKPLTADVKGLFTALGKGIGHTAVGKWEELANDAIAAGSALGLTTEPGELAYLLIRRSITSALFELVGESASLHLVEVKKSASDLEDALAIAVGSSDVQIDEKFFDRPAELPFIAEIQALLKQWLSIAGLPSHVAAAIAERFPAYFVFALNHEWRANTKTYAPLLEAVGTPFAKAGERELGWRTYASLLQRRIQEGVFDEAFSLQQLYVPLRAYYTEEPPSKQVIEPDERRSKRIVVDLEKELDSWLRSAKPADAIRVISGGPGSGKSSVARVYAARVAAEGKTRVLFVPLHLFDIGRDLVGEVGRFVADEGVLPTNPLDNDSPEPNLLIIFDGLDELATQGKAAAEAARQFIDEVERTVNKRNSNSVKIRVLVSGRELIIQQNESSFRQPRQILTLLPYHVAKGEHTQFQDPSGLLGVDQRQQWWSQYGAAAGRAYDGLPKALSRDDLEEVTGQPLLNYLVALSLTRDKIDFEKSVNLNEIYADLLSAVYERAYEKRRPYAPIRHMRFDDFVRVLEEIGVAAWHGDGRSTTIREIEEHCGLAKIGRLLDTFKEGAEAGVTRLLAAFFFRQYGRRASGDATFVFTHKSFGEYLAARRVVRAMDRVARERQIGTESAGEGWSETEALKYWVDLCGPSAMTEYLITFVRNELALREVDALRPTQECLARLFSHVLRNDMPMELLQTRAFRIALAQSNNAAEALLAVMNACARHTQQVSMIEHPTELVFREWLERIVGLRATILRDCLSYLYLEGCSLALAYLGDADLSYSILDEANLKFAYLSEAKLIGTNLQKANAKNAHFFHSDLTGADLTGAFLDDSDFSGANLRDVKMKGITFDGADFEFANVNSVIADEGFIAVLRSK